MRRKSEKILTSLLIATLLISPALAWDVPTQTHPSAAMWMEPNDFKFETGDVTVGYEDNVSVGYTFIVTVYLNASKPVSAWSFRINYNSTWLNCTDAVYSGTGGAKSQLFEKSASTTGMPLKSLTPGSVLLGEFLFPVQAPWGPANDSSSLAYLTFNVTAIPIKGQKFTSDLVFAAIKTDTNYVDDANNYYWKNDPTYIMSTFDGDAEFIWSAPPKPYFTVDPLEKLIDKYTNATCKVDFDVDVVIANYYAAWGMTNATFCLSYNSTMINATALVLNTADWPGPNENSTSHGVDTDWVNVTVRGFVGGQDGGASVLVATITFHVEQQCQSPPRSAGDYEETALAFCDETEVWNHREKIDVAPKDGKVKIECLLAIPIPHLAVEPSTIIFGPAPAVGEQFTVDIIIKNLHFNWYLVGMDFFLKFCPEYLDVVKCEQGPYFDGFPQRPGPPYKITTCFCPDAIPDRICCFQLILPCDNGTYLNDVNATVWPLPGAEPPEDGTVFKLTFEVIKQDVSCDPEDYICDLNITDLMFVSKTGGTIDYDPPQNATVTIKGSYAVGRVIDLTAGGSNASPNPWPAPFGGQGWHKPSDMFWPQKIVYLYAEVTYNCWPVQDKIVSFEIEGPFNQTTFNATYEEPLPRYKIWAKLTAITDKKGIAWVKFQMPWTGCEDPEELFGKWKVTATVDICEVCINDTLAFDYEYLVEWVGIKTDVDPPYYCHCWSAIITVEWKSKAQQPRPVLVCVTIIDELEVPIGIACIQTTVSGAQPCTYEYYKDGVNIHIPKWAFSGYATLHVNAFNKDPTDGGCAWCPQYHDAAKYPNPWALPDHPWLVGKPWIYILPCPLDP